MENGPSKLSYREISEKLNVDPSTVYRTVILFEETGTVYSLQVCHENTNKKMSTSDEMAIMEMIVDCPSMYLHEVQTSLLQLTGTSVSTATYIVRDFVKIYSSTEE